MIDKTENNPVAVNGHPAWAVEYNINTDTYRTMDVVSNTFCAGGTSSFSCVRSSFRLRCLTKDVLMD